MTGVRTGSKAGREITPKSYPHSTRVPEARLRELRLIATGRTMSCVRCADIPYSAKHAPRAARNKNTQLSN
jgi:hypothetical protein